MIHLLPTTNYVFLLVIAGQMFLLPIPPPPLILILILTLATESINDWFQQVPTLSITNYHISNPTSSLYSLLPKMHQSYPLLMHIIIDWQIIILTLATMTTRLYLSLSQFGVWRWYACYWSKCHNIVSRWPPLVF